MALNVNAILKLSIAAGALIAGTGIGYYYGIFLPAESIQQTLEAGQLRQAEAADRRATLERTRALEARRREAAQQQYEVCLAAAEATYSSRWAAGCRTQHLRQRAAYEDCADDWFRTREGCQREFPVEPAQGCALPASISSRLSAQRDAARTQCLGELQSGV